MGSTCDKRRKAALEIAKSKGSGSYHTFMDFLEGEYREALLTLEVADSEAEMLRWQGAARALNSMISQITSRREE